MGTRNAETGMRNHLEITTMHMVVATTIMITTMMPIMGTVTTTMTMGAATIMAGLGLDIMVTRMRRQTSIPLFYWACC